jgi:hypothetical protein
MRRWLAVALCWLAAGGWAAKAEPAATEPAASWGANSGIEVLTNAAPPIASPAARSEPLPIKPGESQLWLISTRTLPGPGVNACNGSWEVYYFPQGGGAMASSLEEFLASGDPRLITVVFVHGNDTEAAASVAEGAQLCRVLSTGCGRPLRFVIWSWPSQHQESHLLTDLRLKLARTDVEPFYLAEVLQALPPDAPLCLIGFSFGCRITAGTLHLLGGGSLDGHALATAAPSRQSPIRAMLLAAALGSDTLLPQGKYGRAMSQTDQMLITVNRRDRVLHYFPLLRADRAVAVGLTGLVGMLEGVGSQISPFNVSSYLRHHHAFRKYLEVPEILDRVRSEVETTGQRLPSSMPKLEVDAVSQLDSPSSSEAIPTGNSR